MSAEPDLTGAQRTRPTPLATFRLDHPDGGALVLGVLAPHTSSPSSTPTFASPNKSHATSAASCRPHQAPGYELESRSAGTASRVPPARATTARMLRTGERLLGGSRPSATGVCTGAPERRGAATRRAAQRAAAALSLQSVLDAATSSPPTCDPHPRALDAGTPAHRRRHAPRLRLTAMRM